MSRTVKLVAYAALFEMALVALGAIAWRYGLLPWLPAAGPANPRMEFGIVWGPAVFVAALIYADRRLRSVRPRISDSHRGYLEASIQVGAVAIAALQGLVAYVDVTGAVMNRELLLRGAIVVAGVWFTIQGNAAAKIDPPSGDGAPAPGVWTRTLLRFGWIMVGLGLASVLCAMVLPLTLLLPFWIAVGVIGVVLEIVYRRMTRPARAA